MKNKTFNRIIIAVVLILALLGGFEFFKKEVVWAATLILGAIIIYLLRYKIYGIFR